MKNKTKIIMTNRGINRTIIATQGRYGVIKINNLIFLIEGTIKKNVINNSMKCYNIPLLWRKFFLNFANNREFVCIYCNRPFKNFHQHCREWNFHNSTDGDDIRMLNDEMNNYAGHWYLVNQTKEH